jgi:biofilm PGA synthesis N-glycosyltransferase PgaC
VTSTLIGFFVFWGIWLFVPLLIDGTTAISYFIGAWRYERTHRRRRQQAAIEPPYPTVTIIVPVYNGESYLASCLESIKQQTYPHDELHVIVVDNLSTDRTREVFEESASSGFGGRMELVSLSFRGKAWALNAGIYMSGSDYVCNVDSDTTLKEDAIYNMVRAFEDDPGLAAATGTIEVLPVESKNMHPLRYVMVQAEYIEYYMAFRIGRQFQSVTKSLFTLAGAFSFFRRNVLLQTSLYSNMTVSEDTNLTFEVYDKFPGMYVMTVAEAVAYVEPSPSLASLYAQRVRWQRGELEVMALYPQYLRNPLKLTGMNTIKSLLIDHTLAFPRVVWTFLFPLMFFMGYPLGLVVSAVISIYLAYVGIDALYMLVGYALADKESKLRLRNAWWVFWALSVFRYITFWFRFGGFLEVLMEPPQWRVRNPWVQTLDGLLQLRASTMALFTQMSQSRLVSILVNLLRGS